MLMEILHLYFPLCCRPVLLFLGHFASSPSFLLFHLFVYKGQISVLKRAFSWGKRVWSKNFLGAWPPDPLFSPYAQEPWSPRTFPARTAPGHRIELPNSIPKSISLGGGGAGGLQPLSWAEIRFTRANVLQEQ